jgi:hypothetical protein
MIDWPNGLRKTPCQFFPGRERAPNQVAMMAMPRHSTEERANEWGIDGQSLSIMAASSHRRANVTTVCYSFLAERPYGKTRQEAGEGEDQG